jgi:hypothetical protein
LIRTRTLRELGGYTELKGVGHEDYELFLRMLEAGKKIEIVPRPLYFYEVGRPSMLSRTSMTANFRRCFDAVGMADGGEMRDVLSLTLGKKVAVDGHNRQWWLYSQTPTATLRHRVMADCRTREDALQTLMQLARAEGNVAMALAVAEDLASMAKPDTATAEAEFVTLEPMRAPQSITASSFDPGLAAVKADLVLRRHDAALHGVIRHIGEKRQLNAEILGVIRELVGSALMNEEGCRSLLDVLARARVPRALLEEVIVLQAAVERVARIDGITHALMEVVVRDEAAYLALHPDVCEAVADRRFARAGEHFLVFGYREGRPGFVLTSQVAQLATAAGAGVEIEALLESVIEETEDAGA